MANQSLVRIGVAPLRTRYAIYLLLRESYTQLGLPLDSSA